MHCAVFLQVALPGALVFTVETGEWLLARVAADVLGHVESGWDLLSAEVTSQQAAFKDGEEVTAAITGVADRVRIKILKLEGRESRKPMKF